MKKLLLLVTTLLFTFNTSAEYEEFSKEILNLNAKDTVKKLLENDSVHGRITTFYGCEVNVKANEDQSEMTISMYKNKNLKYQFTISDKYSKNGYEYYELLVNEGFGPKGDVRVSANNFTIEFSPYEDMSYAFTYYHRGVELFSCEEDY